jgi:spore germination cell wall hydrolase CwlJ-like protein
MATTNAMSPSGVYTDWNTGPEAAPYIKRSKYLAAALQGMQESGKSIQSYPELGLKLLSQAILSYGDKKNDEKLKGAQQKDIGNEMSTMLTSLGGGATPSPSAPDTSMSPQMAMGDTSIAPAPQSAPITSTDLPSLAPPTTAKSSRDLDLLARTLLGEAGNQGPQGQQAVAQVIVNRAKQSGQPISDVIMAKGQFEPWGNPRTRAQLEAIDTNSPQYQDALTNAQAVLNGSAQLPPAVAGADHFYSPTSQAKLGRPPPSWDNGSGTDMGGHRFFGLGYGGQPPVAPGAPPQGMPQSPQAPPAPPPMQQQPQMAQTPPQLSMTELAGPQGGAQPFQVAQNGGLPPMPSSAMGGAPAAPQPPQGGHGATPDEIALIKSLMASNNPQKVEAARSLALKIQQRIAAPPSYKIQMVNGVPAYVPEDPRDGGMLPIQVPGSFRSQTQSAESAGIPAPHGTTFNVDPLGNRTQVYAPPTGYQQGPNGLAPIQGGPNDPHAPQNAYSAPYKIEGAPGLYVNSPTGKPEQAATAEYGPGQLAELRNGILKSDDYKTATESYEAYQAMRDNVGKANGMSAYSVRDTFARAINPGAVARVGTIQAIEHAQGVPEQIKSFMLNLQGEGNMSPEIQQQILDATLPFVQANMRSVQSLNRSNADYAKRHHIDPADVTAPLPPLPDRFVLPKVQGNGSDTLSHDGGAPANSGVGGIPARPRPGQAPVQAPDGNYYIADPKRPGKYLRVVQ